MKITLLLLRGCSQGLLAAGAGGSPLAAPGPDDGCHRPDPALNSKLGALALPEYPQPCSLQRKAPMLALKIKTRRVLVLRWAQRPLTSPGGSKQPQNSIPVRSLISNYHCNIWHINTSSRIWMGFKIHFRASVLLVPGLRPASSA